MTTLYGRVVRSVSGIFQNLAERTASYEEMHRKFGDQISSSLRVAIPAEVVSFNAEEMTVVARPLIREKIKLGGKVEWVKIPNLLDVPVHFPQGGDYAITLPIEAGDEGLVIFADMCIDAWWARGGLQNWMDRRRHDLSDGFFIPGVNSKPNVISDIAANALEIRRKDNTVKITISANDVTITAADDIILNAGDQIQLNGDLRINGNSYDSHRHTDVQSGASNTGTVYLP